jgi:hypothetical protein
LAREQGGLPAAAPATGACARDGDEARFRRAAAKWVSRYVRETRAVEPAEVQAVVGLLTMLAGPRRQQAASGLARLLDRRQHLPAAELLSRL